MSVKLCRRRGKRREDRNKRKGEGRHREQKSQAVARISDRTASQQAM